MAHTFDTVKFAAKKQARKDIEDQPSGDIKNVPELKARVLKLEKVVGIESS